MAKEHKVRFDFWLRVNRPEEGDIADQIAELKKTRKYHSVIRDGITILSALLKGDMEPLLKQFPWIYDAIIVDYLHHNAPESTTGGNSGDSGNGGYDAHMKRLEAKIDMLQDTVVQNGSPNGMVMDAHEAQRKLTSGKPAPADFDASLLEVKAAQSDARNRSDWNFMIASALNVYGNFDSLPPDILAYGVETKRIPADKLPEKVPVHVPEPIKPQNEIKTLAGEKAERTPGGLLKMKGADVVFAEPDFSDLEATF